MYRLLSVLFLVVLTAAGCRRDVEPAEGPAHLEAGAATDLAATPVDVEEAGDEAQSRARNVVEQFLDLDFQGARLYSEHPLRSEFESLLAETEGGSETVWVVDDFRVLDVAPGDGGYLVTAAFPNAVLLAGDFEPIETRSDLRAELLVRDGQVIEEGGIAHVGVEAVVAHVRRIATAEEAQALERRLAETLGVPTGS